jgi:hypothetical protein
MPLYSITKWFGGISWDKYAWPAGWVYNAVNVNVSWSKWVILSSDYWLTNLTDIFTTSEWKPIAVIDSYSSVNRLIATRNWRLRSFIGTNYDISAKLSQVSNMWIIDRPNSKIWFIYWWGKIYRWTLSNNLDLWIWTAWANIVDSTIVLPLDTNGGSSSFYEKSPFLVRGNFLYVVWWNGHSHNIFTIDVSIDPWAVLSSYLTIDRWYDIVYMSNIWDQIIIYASNGSIWKQYFWDGQSETYDYSIDWYDRPILAWASINNIDYVVTWTTTKRELYQVQWYNAIKISQSELTSNTEFENFYFDPTSGWANIIETISDTLILPAQWHIYKYWNNKIGLQKHFTKHKTYWNICALYYNDSLSTNLLVFTQSTSFSWSFQYLLFSNNIRNQNDNTAVFPIYAVWTIEWLKFDWGAYAIKKEWVKCKIWYKLENRPGISGRVWWWINVYARVNDEYKYVNFYVYQYNNANYTTKPSIWSTYTTNGKTFTVYDITDKIELDSGGNQSELKGQWLILHCTCSDERYSIVRRWEMSWTLTKATWDGDATFRYYMADEWYELIQKIRNIDNIDFNSREKMFMFKKNFHEVQFKFDIFTTDWQITPTLYDFHMQYNFIQNNIWS